MAKKLQLILSDADYADIRRIARSRGLSLTAWVRHTLELARRSERPGDIARKLEVVRAAVRHEFPVSDIDGILKEIDRNSGST